MKEQAERNRGQLANRPLRVNPIRAVLYSATANQQSGCDGTRMVYAPAIGPNKRRRPGLTNTTSASRQAGKQQRGPGKIVEVITNDNKLATARNTLQSPDPGQTPVDTIGLIGSKSQPCNGYLPNSTGYIFYGEELFDSYPFSRLKM